MGYLFTLPFAIGFVVLFAVPFFQSVVFSLNELRITQTGYTLDYVGWANFQYALFVQPEFTQRFVTEIGRMVSQVPLILVFSFFAAVLINQEFTGRLIARVIFFLPVIMSAGIIVAMENADYIMQSMQTEVVANERFFSGVALRSFLMQIGLPRVMLQYLITAVDSIPVIIRAGGIQILIFLAGLQSIPRSLYEAARVEGTTEWESFWLITLPMLSPLILTNIVYTIIDFLTGRHNEFLSWIQSHIFGVSYGQGTAMAMMYFAATTLILAITVILVSRWVFYEE